MKGDKVVELLKESTYQNLFRPLWQDNWEINKDTLVEMLDCATSCLLIYIVH